MANKTYYVSAYVPTRSAGQRWKTSTLWTSHTDTEVKAGLISGGATKVNFYPTANAAKIAIDLANKKELDVETSASDQNTGTTGTGGSTGGSTGSNLQTWYGVYATREKDYKDVQIKSVKAESSGHADLLIRKNFSGGVIMHPVSDKAVAEKALYDYKVKKGFITDNTTVAQKNQYCYAFKKNGTWHGLCVESSSQAQAEADERAVAGVTDVVTATSQADADAKAAEYTNNDKTTTEPVDQNKKLDRWYSVVQAKNTTGIENVYVYSVGGLQTAAQAETFQKGQVGSRYLSGMYETAADAQAWIDSQKSSGATDPDENKYYYAGEKDGVWKAGEIYAVNPEAAEIELKKIFTTFNFYGTLDAAQQKVKIEGGTTDTTDQDPVDQDNTTTTGTGDNGGLPTIFEKYSDYTAFYNAMKTNKIFQSYSVDDQLKVKEAARKYYQSIKDNEAPVEEPVEKPKDTTELGQTLVGEFKTWEALKAKLEGLEKYKKMDFEKQIEYVNYFKKIYQEAGGVMETPTGEAPVELTRQEKLEKDLAPYKESIGAIVDKYPTWSSLTTALNKQTSYPNLSPVGKARFLKGLKDIYTAGGGDMEVGTNSPDLGDQTGIAGDVVDWTKIGTNMAGQYNSWAEAKIAIENDPTYGSKTVEDKAEYITNMKKAYQEAGGTMVIEAAEDPNAGSTTGTTTGGLATTNNNALDKLLEQGRLVSKERADRAIAIFNEKYLKIDEEIKNREDTFDENMKKYWKAVEDQKTAYDIATAKWRDDLDKYYEAEKLNTANQIAGEKATTSNQMSKKGATSSLIRDAQVKLDTKHGEAMLRSFKNYMDEGKKIDEAIKNFGTLYISNIKTGTGDQERFDTSLIDYAKEKGGEKEKIQMKELEDTYDAYQGAINEGVEYMARVDQFNKMWTEGDFATKKDLLVGALKGQSTPGQDDGSGMVTFENISPAVFEEAVKMDSKQDALIYIYYQAGLMNQARKLEQMNAQATATAAATAGTGTTVNVGTDGTTISGEKGNTETTERIALKKSGKPFTITLPTFAQKTLGKITYDQGENQGQEGYAYYPQTDETVYYVKDSEGRMNWLYYDSSGTLKGKGFTAGGTTGGTVESNNIIPDTLKPFDGEIDFETSSIFKNADINVIKDLATKYGPIKDGQTKEDYSRSIIAYNQKPLNLGQDDEFLPIDRDLGEKGKRGYVYFNNSDSFISFSGLNNSLYGPGKYGWSYYENGKRIRSGVETVK